MNKILFLFIILSVNGCKSELEDVSFDSNPYDEAYSGEKVLKVESVKTIILSPTHHPVIIDVKVLTQLYSSITLFRNGTLFFKMKRNAHGNELMEEFTDNSALVGNTYVYTALLNFDEGRTLISDPYSYTKPF